MTDDTRELISVLRKDIEEEYQVWFENGSDLAELIGSAVSSPRNPRSAKHCANALTASPKEY